MKYDDYESPVGRILMAGDAEGLRLLSFASGDRSCTPASDWTRSPDPFVDVVRQLDAYFAGDRQTFDLRLAPTGTEFQLKVWHQLLEIPYGETISYGELARRIGSPKGSRAVGLANGANPLPIVVPCHRVIGSDGSLTGYGGGLRIKRALLDLERRNRAGAQGELFA